MKHTLHLLGPGHPPPPEEKCLILLDARWHPEEEFSGAAHHMVAGGGVEMVERDGRRGYMLSEAERDGLAGAETCPARVLFFAGTDTDVKTLAPVARACEHPLFVVYSTSDRSAVHALESEGLPFQHAPGRGAAFPEADVAVLTNDWGMERRNFIRRCRARGIPTVCLQEAANVDFDGPQCRMRWADVAFLQGPHALRYLDRDVAFLTGNPRFDGVAPLPFPEQPLVLINCNFIFGVAFLEWARPWTDQVVAAVKELGLDYRITVHPRDETDLTGLDNVTPSGAYKVHEQLAHCSILVSRDSSLPYEAVLLNRHAIYFDPFNEKERTLREDETGFIAKCSAPGELRACLTRLLELQPPADQGERYGQAIQSLFTGADGESGLRVARGLRLIAANPERYATTDARRQSALAGEWNAWLHLTLRPRVRRIAWLRALWRRAKRLKMKLTGW